MKSSAHDVLLAQIAELEQERHQAELAARFAKHELEKARTEQVELQRRVKTMQTLNLSLFSTLDTSEIYQLACESIVYQLGWDSVLVVTLEGGRVKVAGSYQATRRQIASVEEYLGASPTFVDLYTSQQAFSTFHSADKAALALRTLLQTDELIAMPILYGDRVFSYLVVCSHSGHSRERQDVPDLDFLSTICGQVGHAVQNTLAFNSLNEQNIRLHQLDELKNSFISITSHQLRTPLSIVKWILSLLQVDVKIAKLPEQHKLVNQAYESNERMIHVVNNLLDVSRIQEGKLPYTPQTGDLKSLVREVVEGCRNMVAYKALKVEARIDDQVPFTDFDQILMKGAIQNLLDNAAAYNRPGGWIRAAVRLTPKEIQIAVTNTGPGVRPKDREKLFDQFYRSPEAIRQQPNGNGLGLYLTRAIIRQHGGDISCESVPEKETTFTVHLPLPKGRERGQGAGQTGPDVV